MYVITRKNQENEGQEVCIMSSDSPKPETAKLAAKPAAKPVAKKPEEKPVKIVEKKPEKLESKVKKVTPQKKIITPTTASRSMSNPSPSQESPMSWEQIEKFYDDVTKGKYVGKEKLRQEIEAKIDKTVMG